LLVGHLAALADPVAEIDIWQAAPSRFQNMPENQETAGAAAFLLGIEEAVDEGEAVLHCINQADGIERSVGFAKFAQAGLHRALRDDRPVIAETQTGHAAIGVARQQVAMKKLVMPARRAGGDSHPTDIGIGLENAAERLAEPEILGSHPDRDAGA